MYAFWCNIINPHPGNGWPNHGPKSYRTGFGQLSDRWHPNLRRQWNPCFNICSYRRSGENQQESETENDRKMTALYTIDTLDFSKCTLKWEIGYGHLVVPTTNQVHIYNEKYINTPLSIFDGRSNVKITILGQKWVVEILEPIFMFQFSFPISIAGARNCVCACVLGAMKQIRSRCGHMTWPFVAQNSKMSFSKTKYNTSQLHSIAYHNCLKSA